jgi:succinate dehydrogenase/fumarate reductase cytochrome b subunit
MSRAQSKSGLSEYTLFRIQAGSGILFATFLVLHLSNTILASAGQTTYDAYQGALRWYYQFPLVEIAVVVGSATVHAWAGITRGLRRVRKFLDPESKRFVPPLRARLHRWCGYIILLILPGHISGTRMPGLMEGLPADFSFVYFSIKNWPWFFYPYLLLYGVAASYHLIHGLLISLGVIGLPSPGRAMDEKSRPFWTAFVALSLLVIFGILALGGNLFAPNTDRFPELKAFYESKFQKIFMPWKEEP